MHLVFLHGFAHTPASWAEVIAALPPARAFALCPVPGHAAEAPLGPTWDQTIDLLAARIPTDALVIGYSLGARLALGLLARDHIARAILISVNPGLAATPDRAARRAADAAWSALLRAGGTARFLDAWEAQPILATADRAPTAVRTARRAAREALDPDRLADAMDVLGLGAMPELRAELIARADRVLLVAGADDAKFRALAEALAPTTLVTGSGHDPTLEAPARLAAVIEAALARWR